jgi:hypothetical protein
VNEKSRTRCAATSMGLFFYPGSPGNAGPFVCEGGGPALLPLIIIL